MLLLLLMTMMVVLRVRGARQQLVGRGKAAGLREGLQDQHRQLLGQMLRA